VNWNEWLFQASTYFPSSIVVGLLALIGVRWTLSDEHERQRVEWTRRESVLEKQIEARERMLHDAEEQRLTAAIHALIVEAVNNALAMKTFQQIVKANPPIELTIDLSREQFDHQLPLIAERLGPGHLQDAASAYMQAFRYKLLIENLAARRESLSLKQVEQAFHLEMGFCILFRSAGPSVFGAEQMSAFEALLRIAHAYPIG
jgi:hypothetical protein